MSSATLTDLWHDTCRRVLLTRRGYESGMGIMFFDTMLSAASMQYEMDVSQELWMTKSRFTSLQRDYLEKDPVLKFIQQATELPPKRAALCQLMARVKPKNHPLKYRWGNCILGFTFRDAPRPVFSMFSRTTAITRMGGLDLALAYCLASMIAEARNDEVEDFGFRWHIAALQHSSMNGVPYFYSHGYDRYLDKVKGYPSKEFPAMKAMRRQAEYFDDLDRRGIVSKYGTRARIRKQRREFISGELKRPAVPLSRLNLEPLLERD